MTVADLVAGNEGESFGAGRAREQSRARYPDAEGWVERNGVRLFYEVYGQDEPTLLPKPTLLLLPTWSVVSSRMWKMQIPYLARHARVVAFDGRGNGRSDRPTARPNVDRAERYSVEEFAADAIAVLDATSTDRAVAVAVSCGALWGSMLAADHPERVEGIVYIGPAAGLAPGHPERQRYQFAERYDTSEGWAKYNQHYWRQDYPDFLQFFFEKCLNEPHSTKAIEDCVGWGLDTDPETLIAATEGLFSLSVAQLTEALSRIRAPPLVTLEGSGHLPFVRDPVAVNRLLREFACPRPPSPHWTRGRSRRRRALFVSSPIGLGHVRRDAAIAATLRELRPGLEIDWLAQPPVTGVLESLGERVHPASRFLASDYNAEMIEQIARYPRLRDRSIFVGDTDDVVTDHFGPGLPGIREWAEQHFDFPGYITGFDPAEFADREAIRDELGWRPDEKVCVVTVGGTSVGASLLHKVIRSYPLARRLVPELRMIAVTGPRIDPATLVAPAGVEVVGFVPDLYRHLAACDIAIAQGGLSTAMELTASQRPFLYFPLAHHFEQNIHVRHRLNRHRAGRPMDYTTDGPEEIARAMAQELARTVDYLPVDPHGARRAATLLAEML